MKKTNDFIDLHNHILCTTDIGDIYLVEINIFCHVLYYFEAKISNFGIRLVFGGGGVALFL